MGWTYHPDELDGLGANAIPTILYELYQAAYERIEAQFYYLSKLREVKAAIGYRPDLAISLPILDSDFLEYHLPKYNEEIVTSPDVFLGLPISGVGYLAIVQSINTAVTASGITPVWPDYVPITISTDPETALNSRFWRTAMAWIASHRIISLPSDVEVFETNSSNTQHEGYATFQAYVQGQGYGDTQYFATIDTPHTITSSSSTSVKYFSGVPWNVVSSSSFIDNIAEYRQAVADFFTINALAPPTVVTDHSPGVYPNSNHFQNPRAFYNGFVLSGTWDVDSSVGAELTYPERFYSTPPPFPVNYANPGWTLENISSPGTINFSVQIEGSGYNMYDMSFPGIGRATTLGNYISAVALSPYVPTETFPGFVYGSNVISRPIYSDLKDVVEYGLDNWYPPSYDLYFTAPTEPFDPYTY